MNRFLSLLLSLSMLLGLCACGETSQNTPAPVPDESPAPIVDVTETPDDTAAGEEQPSFSETEEEPAPPEEPEQSEELEEPEEYVRTIDPYGKMVALTFDDGPHETYSNIILDVLEEYHSVATFFEVGRNVRAYPEVLQRMAELGCEIASHSNVHHDLTTLSLNALLTDLGYADEHFVNATGVAPGLVRPPYGAVNKRVKNETGRAMISWTVDTRDWSLRDSQKLIEYFQSYPDFDGEVVLLHSIHGSTAEAMKTVVPWLIEQGYQLVTVSELLAYYYGVLMEPNVYYDQNWFLRHGRTEYPLELPAEPMKTAIPAYTIVPVVPETSVPETPAETPEISPETPPEVPPETPPETPPEGGETETPPAPDEGGADEPVPPAEDPAPDEETEQGGEIVPPPAEEPDAEPEPPSEEPPVTDPVPPQDGEE